MKYEVDLLIKEKRGNSSIPKLIIESKYGKITTHDTITYSNKAKAYKDLYSGLRYGLMIGSSNEKGVSPRIIQHGNEFDFMFVFGEDIPNEKEWKIFVDVVKKNLVISNRLENIISDRRKIKLDIVVLRRILNSMSNPQLFAQIMRVYAM